MNTSFIDKVTDFDTIDDAVDFVSDSWMDGNIDTDQHDDIQDMLVKVNHPADLDVDVLKAI